MSKKNELKKQMKKGYVIAVHAGAGYHSERDSTVYEAGMRYIACDRSASH